MIEYLAIEIQRKIWKFENYLVFAYFAAVDVKAIILPSRMFSFLRLNTQLR